MDDLKQLANKNDVLQLSKSLQKIARAIEQQKKDKTKKETAIKELIFLKEQCQSNHIISIIGEGIINILTLDLKIACVNFSSKLNFHFEIMFA